MWFRAAATAVAVWCVSSAAMANGYAEVWNPPEAAAHARHGAVKRPAAKPATKVTAKNAGKHGVSVAKAKRATRDGIGHAATAGAKGTRGTVGTAAVAGGNAKSSAARVAQGKTAHAQIVRTKPGQAKAVHADIAQGHAAHGDALKRAGTGKGAATQPAPAEPDPRTLSANAGAEQADAATNPATARSGSLPPILH
ncbi:hypothetical protein [Burkholderia sp. WSM2230]|uniref:hypothetical protein n=1 Tax=Burkholderia sp. WSM2230 TaxID=944435 RepID=UPI0003FCF3A8|nr:hypothetical protein [Burkholderia sp. WSM2230]